MVQHTLADKTYRRRVADKFAAVLAAGTITAGLGAALVGGTAVAYADTGSAGSPTHTASDTSGTSPSQHDSATAAAGRAAVGKPAPRVRATGGAITSTSGLASVRDSGSPAAAVPTTKPVSLSLVTTTDVTPKTAAAAKPPTVQSVLADIARGIQYTFFNKAPTVDPTQNAQSGPDKAITGALNGTSNNGYAATYTVTGKPKYGEVTLDPKTGEYTYVARPELVEPGIIDGFTVTVSNGTTAKLPGLLGQVQLLLHSMAVAVGAAKPDTVEKDITVTVTGTGIYGAQQKNADWWQDQVGDNTCVLVADAGVIGQLTGSLPNEQAMVTLAKATDSVVKPGRKMYLGSQQDTGESGMAIADGIALLMKFGITATYDKFNAPAQRGQSASEAKAANGQRALTALSAALAGGNAVMVDVDAATIVDAAKGQLSDTVVTETNHMIVVTGVDTSAGLVFVNDGNLSKGSVGIPIAAFNKAWGADNFGLAIAQKAAAASSLAAPAAALAA